MYAGLDVKVTGQALLYCHCEGVGDTRSTLATTLAEFRRANEGSNLIY